MVNRVLAAVTEALNEFLGSYYNVPESVAELGGIGGEDLTNKMVVSLLNVERETVMGITSGYRAGEGNGMAQGAPAWHLNIYFVVAAVFDGKRYGESLKMLSSSIGFLQQNSVFQLDGKQTFTIEPVTMGIQELTNVWSMLGGHYYPSVVCKLRMLTFDGGEVRRTVTRIKGMNM